MNTRNRPLSSRAVTRRRFLAQTTGAVAACMVVPGHVLGLSGAESPNNKLNIAGIGVGRQGAADLNGMTSENIVALCDVDSSYAAPAFQRFPKAKTFRDYRKMLDAMGREIDAVMIGTPDHTHAVIALRAIRTGKHVYCEKPLAHSIVEVRALVTAARQHEVTTQLGNQGHSFDTIRAFREWIEDGAIGRVREVHAMCGSVYSRINQLEEVQQGRPVPAGLDWDLWLGPAPARPYHPAYAPRTWRGWTAFGTGVIGDWTCHVIDPVFWALDLEAPTHIEAVETTDYDPARHSETFPAGSVIRYQFPAKGPRPAVALTWYDGRHTPPRPPELDADEELPKIGAVVVGEKGKIIYGSHGAARLRLLPDALMAGRKKNPQRLRPSPGHQKEWIQACKDRTRAGSDFGYGGRLTELALLGVIAMRFRGQRLEWDSASMQFRNQPQANLLLKPAWREGWTL